MVGISSLECVQAEVVPDMETPCDGHLCVRFLSAVDQQLPYLPDSQRQDVINLLHSHPMVVNDVRPIKQHVYRCPPAKTEAVKRGHLPRGKWSC